MRKLNRRTFLAGSAALLAAPAMAAPISGDVDLAIIGAGAAGIAAARRAIASKVRVMLLEAAPRVGGRCVTDTRIFGVPFDQGAHWIHRPQTNPVVKAASGFDIYSAPRGQRLRVPPRAAREGESEEYLASLVRANRAIIEAGRGKGDMPAASALPRDLGDWRDSVEFALGPYSVGKALSEVSAVDFARAPERDADSFCREGYGALLAKLAAGLPMQLSTPVTNFDWSAGLRLDTPNGVLRARSVIVTASTNVLTSGKIEFTPTLPKRLTDAAAKLSLGAYEHIALDMPRNPFALDRDDLVLEKASGPQTAALLANIGGTNLCTVDVAGSFGRDLAKQGEGAMTAFALEWLTKIFGSDAKGAVKRSAVTRWSQDPLALGAFSVAAPGEADARRILQEPLRDRVFFAGEAAHESLWGTVNGAWESGTRAAERALRLLGALKQPDDEPKQRRQRRRRE